jgi:hypothetical protein
MVSPRCEQINKKLPRRAHTSRLIAAPRRRVVVREMPFYPLLPSARNTHTRYIPGAARDQITQRINNNQRGVRADTPPIMSNDMCRNYSKTRFEASRAPLVYLFISLALSICVQRSHWAKFCPVFMTFRKPRSSCITCAAVKKQAETNLFG